MLQCVLGSCDVFTTISVLWDVAGKAFSNIESSRTRGGNVKLSYYRPGANIQVHQFTVCAGSAYIPLRNALNRSSVSSVSFKVLALKSGSLLISESLPLLFVYVTALLQPSFFYFFHLIRLPLNLCRLFVFCQELCSVI